MATTKPKSQPTASPETLAFVERMKNDPKIQQLIRDGKESERRGQGVRWEDLKRKHGGH